MAGSQGRLVISSLCFAFQRLYRPLACLLVNIERCSLCSCQELPLSRTLHSEVTGGSLVRVGVAWLQSGVAEE